MCVEWRQETLFYFKLLHRHQLWYTMLMCRTLSWCCTGKQQMLCVDAHVFPPPLSDEVGISGENQLGMKGVHKQLLYELRAGGLKLEFEKYNSTRLELRTVKCVALFSTSSCNVCKNWFTLRGTFLILMKAGEQRCILPLIIISTCPHPLVSSPSRHSLLQSRVTTHTFKRLSRGGEQPEWGSGSVRTQRCEAH